MCYLRVNDVYERLLRSIVLIIQHDAGRVVSELSVSRTTYFGPTIPGLIPQLVSELTVEAREKRIRPLWEGRSRRHWEAQKNQVSQSVLSGRDFAIDVGDSHKLKRKTVKKGLT